VSQFLVTNDIARSGLWGGGIDITRPRLLYMVRKNVEWMYELDPTNETLIDTANYNYALCRNNLQAQKILQISDGGGSISPITPNARPDQLNFTVAASGTILVYGQTILMLPTFKGWNLVLDKNGQPMTQIVTAPIYYLWDRNSAQLTLNQAAITGDEFQITPV